MGKVIVNPGDVQKLSEQLRSGRSNPEETRERLWMYFMAEAEEGKFDTGAVVFSYMVPPRADAPIGVAATLEHVYVGTLIKEIRRLRDSRDELLGVIGGLASHAGMCLPGEISTGVKKANSLARLLHYIQK